MNQFAARPYYIGRFRSLCCFHDAKFHCLTFFYAPLGLLWVVLSDHSLVNENVLAGAAAIDKTVSALYIKPFDGTAHSVICVPAQLANVVLCFLELYCDPPVLCQAMAISFLFSELLTQLSQLLLQRLNLFTRLVVAHLEPVNLLGVPF